MVRRLTLTYLLITLSGLLLLGGGGVWLFGVYTAQQRAAELEGQAEIYAAYLGEVSGSAEALAALAPGLAGRAALPPGVAVRIFGRDGTLLAGDRSLGPFPSRPALAFVRSALPLPASQVVGRRYAARPIGAGAVAIGVVELSHTTAGEEQLRRTLIQTLVPIALGSAGIMALVSLLVARSIARPVGRLQHLAEALAAGELGRRSALPPGRRDEIGRLAASLDHMAEQLAGRIAEAEGERAKLAAVLGGIEEGVVAIDGAGQLLFANAAAGRVMGTGDKGQGTGDKVLMRLRELEIPLSPEKPVDQEVELGSHTLLITATPLPKTIGRTTPTPHSPLPPIPNPQSPIPNPQSLIPATIIILRDITRLKALEQARSRFVRSISHELRTPLTAMRGLLENMQDDARADQLSSLATLEAETTRLGRLVEELLNPSDGGDLLPAERRRVEVGQLARELAALQQGRARRAGVTLAVEVADGVPAIKGDRDRLKQVLLNLLDNALRATAAGGEVVVRVAAHGTTLRVLVDDSGPGVPPELRERIWERGATGAHLGLEATGGAGLGLALVRQIVVGYGGHTWVEESPLGGARFGVELPL